MSNTSHLKLYKVELRTLESPSRSKAEGLVMAINKDYACLAFYGKLDGQGFSLSHPDSSDGVQYSATELAIQDVIITHNTL